MRREEQRVPSRHEGEEDRQGAHGSPSVTLTRKELAFRAAVREEGER
jgi:hypothetical protein